MHENSMKKLLCDCVSWLVLLTGAAQLLLVCGQSSPGMFITFIIQCRIYKMCSVHNCLGNQLSSHYLTAHIN